MGKSNHLGRREFLQKSIGLSGLALGITTIGISLTGCEQDELPFNPSGIQTIRLSDYPQLSAVGGSATIKFKKFSFFVIVIRKANDEFLVVNSTCTHQGCTVDAPRSEFDNLLCPCHGSEFSREDASVVWFAEGGTPRPLKRYQNTFDTTSQTLQIDFSQTI